MSLSIVLMAPDLTESEIRNIPSPPISILFFRQESRILTLPTNHAMDYLLDTLQRYSCSVLCQRRQPPDGIQPEQHSRISTRINLFEEIFNTLKNGYSNENLRYAFSMFHFYLGTLRYASNIVMQAPMRQKMRE